ncbi:MAG: hypothetical protein COB26_11985 [Piscirickettsiaceae bacterium]|nr:MAG: hypothetical protein COB26_11985 [Piscirickettsiaceae bacterium]
MKWILVIFISLTVDVYASEEIVNYFNTESNVDKIYSSQSKSINDEYTVVVAYAVNTKLSLLHHRVGVFIVNENSVETLDLFPPVRIYDFLPTIKKLSTTELIVSFISDYGELKKVKYIINLQSEKKLVERIELKPEGIPDDLL